MLYKDQRVVFDLPNPYIEHKPTGERIAIRWENSSPVVDLEVLEPTDEDRTQQWVKELTPLAVPDSDGLPAATSNGLTAAAATDADMPDANAGEPPAEVFPRQARQL